MLETHGVNGCGLVPGLLATVADKQTTGLDGVFSGLAHTRIENLFAPPQTKAQLDRPADRPYLPYFHPFELRTLSGIPSFNEIALNIGEARLREPTRLILTPMGRQHPGRACHLVGRHRHHPIRYPVHLLRLPCIIRARLQNNHSRTSSPNDW